SGLSQVSAELVLLADEAFECVAYIRRPNWPIRAAVGAAIMVMISVLALGALSIQLPGRVDRLSELVQLLEAAINDTIFLAVAVYFLVTLEARVKRRHALRSLHQLRSVVHIVELHQLTKDP